jgi:hypothetical protein
MSDRHEPGTLIGIVRNPHISKTKQPGFGGAIENKNKKQNQVNVNV